MKLLQDELEAKLGQMRDQFVASCNVFGSSVTASYHPGIVKQLHCHMH